MLVTEQGGEGVGGISGNKNTFIGRGAGRFTTSGNKNTFIGNMAGQHVATGTNNIIIGSGIRALDPDRDNQINIGNIIKAEQKTDSADSNKKYGVLKVCNASGSECLPLSKKSFTCPDKDGAKQFFRGFKDDGTPLCEKERCTPQTGLYFWKLDNQCHHCPRASPLYRKNATPSCISCAGNSFYTGPTTNRCQSTCPSYQINDNGRCRCPHSAPHHYDGACHKCSKYYRSHFWEGMCRHCPQDKPYYAYEYNCVSECPNKYPYGYKQTWANADSGRDQYYCHMCPQEKPFFNCWLCRKCGSKKVLSQNGECSACPENTKFTCFGYSNFDKTPQCCPADRVKSYEGDDYWNRRCCPIGTQKAVSENGSQRCCPPGGAVGSGGQCCPPENINSAGYCCTNVSTPYMCPSGISPKWHDLNNRGTYCHPVFIWDSDGVGGHWECPRGTRRHLTE